MVCPTPTPCGSNAYCSVVGDSYTCRCNSGYSGDGFHGCTKDEGLAEKYVLIIVFVILLVIALVAVAVFCYFRRRINRRIERAKLVSEEDFSSIWADPYTNKWKMMLARNMTESLAPGKTTPNKEVAQVERTVVDPDEEVDGEDGRKGGAVGRNPAYVADPNDLDITINYIEGMEENF